MVTVKELESFKDYGKCLSISNGVIEALATLDIGPRIISFGYVGGQNIMCAEREALGGRGDKEYTDFFGTGRKWENLGGHRVWLSPESYPETYTPDDEPVSYEQTPNGAIFYAKPDHKIGVLKTMEIKMDSDDANIQVKMQVKNIGDKPKEFAIWALSVCAAGGTLIVPTNTNDTGLLPNRKVIVWPYTDMRDNRIYFGNRYVTLRQDENAELPIKLGFDLNCGTAYYVLGNEVLCKKYDTNHPDGKYPDGGCSFETYTNECMLEFETLAELKTVASGETVEHIEAWSLCKTENTVDFKDDASIEKMISEL